MTLWQHVYRLLGGNGPDDDDTDVEAFFNLPHLPGYEKPGPQLARVLIRFGFLKRDPTLRSGECGWYFLHLWQWRFWRTAYNDWADVHLAHLPNPHVSWWHVACRSDWP